MSNVQAADVYTDFNALAGLKAEAKKDSPEALKAVAKQFEALFLNNILKSMRAGKLSEGLLDSQESDSYNEMYDQQLAVHLSGDPGVGLADLIVKQLSPKSAAQNAEGSFNRPANNQALGGSASAIASSSGIAGNTAKLQSNKIDSWINTDTEGSQTIINSYINDSEPLSDMTEIPFKNNNTKSSSTDDFIRQLLPHATQAAKELGIDPKVILAQAALETGWGRSLIKNSNGSTSFNLFNIKADKSWTGKQAQVSALEFDQGIAKKVNSGFRAYSSFKESFADYVDFIKTNPRYGDALKQVNNGERYLQELQQAGYATDPNYANKIMAIYRNNLAGFDPNSIVALH
ncbi:MAG: flagellar assembly peptidoglycan hydrolase FlgJ [Methylococcales bacterium]|nr:MAG: flagellar assembly peptidoglycan hydrolase FlgJ [Methylococcales bacterium]